MSQSETRTATKREVKCPYCGKPSVFSSENPFRPFCSERCRLIDLGQWASESYKIPEENPTPFDADIESEIDDENDAENSEETATITKK